MCPTGTQTSGFHRGSVPCLAFKGRNNTAGSFQSLTFGPEHSGETARTAVQGDPSRDPCSGAGGGILPCIFFQVTDHLYRLQGRKSNQTINFCSGFLFQERKGPRLEAGNNTKKKVILDSKQLGKGVRPHLLPAERRTDGNKPQKHPPPQPGRNQEVIVYRPFSIA